MAVAVFVDVKEEEEEKEKEEEEDAIRGETEKRLTQSGPVHLLL